MTLTSTLYKAARLSATGGMKAARSAGRFGVRLLTRPRRPLGWWVTSGRRAGTPIRAPSDRRPYPARRGASMRSPRNTGIPA